jgi:hypothetical protein
MRTGWLARLGMLQPAFSAWLAVLLLAPIWGGLAPASGRSPEIGAAGHHAEAGCSQQSNSTSPKDSQHQRDRCPCCVLCMMTGCASYRPAARSPDNLIASKRSEQSVAILTATAARAAAVIRLDDKLPRGPPLALVI